MNLPITDYVLLIFLSVSVYTDITRRKVYNWTTLSALILGFGFNFLISGTAGLKESALGMMAGFLFLFFFYLLGGMGAGDVKFMAAVGALKGYHFVIMAGLYGAIAGGIGAILVILAKKNFLPTLKKLFHGIIGFFAFKSPEALKFSEENATFLPYTVFLSIGIIIRWIEILPK